MRASRVCPGDEVEVESAGTSSSAVRFVFQCNGFSCHCTQACGCAMPACHALPRSVELDKLKCHCGKAFGTRNALLKHMGEVRKAKCGCR